LLEERGLGLADSFGKAPERERPALEVRKDQVGDPRVVVDDLRLGGLRLRVEDLVQIGQPYLAATDRDFLRLGYALAFLREVLFLRPFELEELLDFEELFAREEDLGFAFALLLPSVCASSPRTALRLSS